MNKKTLSNTIMLNNNIKIPTFGLGTYKMTNEQEVINAVHIALDCGYRLIDTAQYYRNEEAIGKALKTSAVKREDIFITSKIWNSDHEYDKAVKQIDEILARMQLEYIDLLLIHWATDKWKECYKALEEAYKAGKVKAIGVSNFEPHHLEELMNEFEIMPTVNQIELHPCWRNEEVAKYCQEHNIVVESWGTMIRGKASDYEVLNNLAKKYNKNASQICLKWALQHNYVVIPKSVNPNRILQNSELDDFELTKEDIDLINTLPQERTGPDPNHVDF